MGRWEGFRSKITNFITNNGSTVIITPRTPTAGSYGGYEPASVGAGTAVTTVGISTDYLFKKEKETFGHLKTGRVSITIKYSETVTKDYLVTWQSESYSINEIKNFMAGNVVICKMLLLSRELD